MYFILFYLFRIFGYRMKSWFSIWYSQDFVTFFKQWEVAYLAITIACFSALGMIEFQVSIHLDMNS